MAGSHEWHTTTQRAPAGAKKNCVLAPFFEIDHAADATLKWFAEAGVGVEHRVTPDLNFQPNLQLVPPTHPPAYYTL